MPCGAIAIWSSTTSGAHLSSSFQEGAAARRDGGRWTEHHKFINPSEFDVNRRSPGFWLYNHLYGSIYIYIYTHCYILYTNMCIYILYIIYYIYYIYNIYLYILYIIYLYISIYHLLSTWLHGVLLSCLLTPTLTKSSQITVITVSGFQIKQGHADRVPAKM